MPGCSIKWIGQRGNMPYLLGKVNDPGTERVLALPPFRGHGLSGFLRVRDLE